MDPHGMGEDALLSSGGATRDPKAPPLEPYTVSPSKAHFTAPQTVVGSSRKDSRAAGAGRRLRAIVNEAGQKAILLFLLISYSHTAAVGFF
jgi:hypothetical protein